MLDNWFTGMVGWISLCLSAPQNSLDGLGLLYCFTTLFMLHTLEAGPGLEAQFENFN